MQHENSGTSNSSNSEIVQHEIVQHENSGKSISKILKQFNIKKWSIK